MPFIIVFALLVPCVSSLPHAYRWKLRLPTLQAPDLHSLVSDGCRGGSEKSAPLSLLQVNAGSKRSTAGPKAVAAVAHPNQTGESLPLHGLMASVSSSANQSHAAKLAVQTEASRRVRLSQQKQQQQQQQQRPLLLAAAHPLPSPPNKVVALQSRTASSTQGDAVQGLVFSVIVLVIVVGIYLLVVKDFRLGGDFETALRADGSMKRPPHPAQTAFDFRSGPPPGQSLLGRRSVASGLPTGPLTDPRGSMGRRPEADDWNAELPMIYPQLVMPVAHTRLAVPIEPLAQPNFEVDVLGLSGVPLLSAALVEGVGTRDVQISLHSVSTLIAIVTSGLDILGPDGTHFGKVVKESRPTEALKYVLLDRAGRAILSLNSIQPDTRDFKMTSVSGGRIVERATAVRKPKGKLPADHYEIVANPNVDAVLVLGCFLAVVVFDPVNTVTGSMFRLPDMLQSGRPSTVPRLEPDFISGSYRPYPH
mmetsp:Transcript_6322/g.16968  ORF Transcript_6322/g.16968 Transcript_6322/m.16968 type:complete len:477 (-) Transcript_6322:50-1480(-)